MKPILVLALSAAPAFANDFDAGRDVINKMTGCYLVDYSFAETESLKDGYTIDRRIYDVNRNMSTKEYIYAIEKSASEVRLQHILHSTDLSGKHTFAMKHQAEDWSYEPEYLYDFVAPGRWAIKSLDGMSNHWVRKITNLDDGLRYQCAASFDHSKEYPEWQCANFAPIPGRETRDMGRKDYNTLDRVTKIKIYGDSFLERQDNIKTIFADGVKTPLAKEEGRTWFVRLPDNECSQAAAWAAPRQAFWKIVMEVWEGYYAEKKDWAEKKDLNGMPRFAKLIEVEEKYFTTAGTNPTVDETIRQEIRSVIDAYRETTR